MNITVPKNLTPAQKEALEAFGESMNEKSESGIFSRKKKKK